MRVKLFIYLIAAFFLMLSRLAWAQHIEFIENKNQWPDHVSFKANIPNGSLFLEDNCFTYCFAKEDDVYKSAAHHHLFHGMESEHKHSPWIVHYHAYKVNFLNADCKNIIPSGEKSDYENYLIGNDRSKWATRVRKFETILYQEIYNNIDLKVYDGEQGLKYDFIVKPGANIQNIQMLFDGVDKFSFEENNLVIETSVNKVYEMQPYAYQLVDGHEVQIACEFHLQDSILTFNFPLGYNENTELIIDPQLIFSTYTGSSADNWGFTATPDLYGNVFSGGIVHGTGYPSSTGAFQIDFGGGEAYSSSWYQFGWDVGIIKYTPDGTQRLYATYIGGNSEEMPHSLVVNASNELLIFGTTGSSDFPVSANAYDPTFNGGTNIVYDNVIRFSEGIDLYVSKLSADGTQLLASTYVGGSANDGLNYKTYMIGNNFLTMQGNDSLYYNYADGARGEIITDGKNNVYVGTCTFSNNFPTTNGSFQSYHSGKQEGVVFKLDANLQNMIWSSYFGGSEDDAIYSIDTDADDDVYIAGGTVSNNIPITSGSYQTSFAGGTTDGFVAHISSDGSQLVSSTYFGSNRYDQAYFVRTDKSKNVFITGQTEATGANFIFNAAYGIPAGGQFITKFNNTLSSTIWSTMFGNNNSKPDISITAFTVDVCNRVYLSGCGREWPYDFLGNDWTTIEGTNSLPVTNNAEQLTTDGQDFYIMVLSDDASGIDYATYFGEQHSATVGCGTDHVDGGTSRFDRKGNIYQSVCASCGGCDAFPTTPGVHSVNNNSTNCNNAVFRFSFMDDFCVADFDPPPVGCAPYSFNFNNTSLYATEYYWDFGDNTTSTTEDPNHTYAESGIYNIMLVASNPGTCNLADTIYKQIQVLSNSTDSLAEINICPGDNPQIGVQPSPYPNIEYIWSPTNGLSATDVPNPYASPVTTTEYLLIISNGVCSDSLFQTVIVQNTDIEIEAVPDTAVCYGANISLDVADPGDIVSYQWSNNLNFNPILNANQNQSEYTFQVFEDGTYYIKANGSYCGAYGIDTVNISVIDVGIEAGPDTTICLGSNYQIQAENLIPGDILTYEWNPVNSIISGNNTNSPLVNPSSTTDYIVSATNQHGCLATDTITIATDEVEASLINIQNVSCYNLCDASAQINIQQGISPYDFQWSNNETSQNISGLCEGNYEVTIEDTYGCTKTLDMSVTQPDLLVGELVDTTGSMCDGTCSGEAIVGATGGTTPYSYLWVDGQTTAHATGLCADYYEVTISDVNNCDTII